MELFNAAAGPYNGSATLPAQGPTTAPRFPLACRQGGLLPRRRLRERRDGDGGGRAHLGAALLGAAEDDGDEQRARDDHLPADGPVHDVPGVLVLRVESTIYGTLRKRITRWIDDDERTSSSTCVRDWQHGHQWYEYAFRHGKFCVEDGNLVS